MLTASDPILPIAESGSEGSPVLGQPLFPTYREPPRWLPSAFALSGLAMAAIGVSELLSSKPSACSGRGSLLCQSASKLAHALYGAENPRLADASLFFAGALLFWAFAWHVYSMWRPRKRDDA
jgi:hypothetical protein